MLKKSSLVVLLCLVIGAALFCGCSSQKHVKNVGNVSVGNVNNVNNTNNNNVNNLNVNKNKGKAQNLGSVGRVDSLVKPLIADVFGGANRKSYKEMGYGNEHRIEIMYEVPRKINPKKDLIKLKDLLDSRGFETKYYMASPNGFLIEFNSSSIQGNFTIVASENNLVVVLYKY